jgi:hypothetical protein
MQSYTQVQLAVVLLCVDDIGLNDSRCVVRPVKSTLLTSLAARLPAHELNKGFV